MVNFLLNNKLVAFVEDNVTTSNFKPLISTALNIRETDFYLLQNGRRLKDASEHDVHIVPTLRGGKGGFGSMLRAIGAQIEKTTNREACRDLSGRRLRDINEEKRLKNWIAQQAEREEEIVERKRKKLERLCHKPKHEFKDERYDRVRSELPEKLEDAITQGFEAAAAAATSTQIGNKRKRIQNSERGKKKSKLWVEDDIEDDLSSTDDDSTEVSIREDGTKDLLPFDTSQKSNTKPGDSMPLIGDEVDETIAVSTVQKATVPTTSLPATID